MSTAYN
jgi:hypothetical protein